MLNSAKYLSSISEKLLSVKFFLQKSIHSIHLINYMCRLHQNYYRQVENCSSKIFWGEMLK